MPEWRNYPNFPNEKKQSSLQNLLGLQATFYLEKEVETMLGRG